MNILFTILALVVVIGVWLYFDYKLGLKALRKKSQATSTGPLASKIELITNGEDFIDKLLDDIRKANKHIHIQFYIFRDDYIGKRIVDTLIAKAEAGTDIRLLIDQFGCKLRRGTKKQLRAAGVDVAMAAKVRGPWVFFSLNRRNHRKLAVIDGHTSYLGGFNIGDEYLGRNPFFGFWRDFHVRITGEGSSAIQAQFSADFEAATGKHMERKSFFPDLQAGSQTLQFISTQGTEFEQTLLLLIHSAKNSLIIGSPYFIPTRAVMDAIIQVAQRGVSVSLILPEKADHPLVQHGATPYVIEALQAGVLVYHYYRGFYHVKAVVADQSVCLVGTPNIDKRSFHLNDEMSCLTHDQTFIETVLAVLQADMQASMSITIEQLQKRPLLDRVKEVTAAPLSPLL